MWNLSFKPKSADNKFFSTLEHLFLALLIKSRLFKSSNKLMYKFQNSKSKETNNILNAGPMDRAYSVDYDNSKVIFGDGKHGKIPTEQFGESIRIKYSTTKGKKGNIDASSIGDFESVFPSVLKVYNSNLNSLNNLVT